MQMQNLQCKLCQLQRQPQTQRHPHPHSQRQGQRRRFPAEKTPILCNKSAVSCNRIVERFFRGKTSTVSLHRFKKTSQMPLNEDFFLTFILLSPILSSCKRLGREGVHAPTGSREASVGERCPPQCGKSSRSRSFEPQ